MNPVLLATAVIMIFGGHILRGFRWKSLLGVYEKAPSDLLFRSMGLGYLTDLFIPFHAGDLVRALTCGRKLKNRTSFALASIIVDRLLDVHIVAAIYLALWLFKEPSLAASALAYIGLALMLTIIIGWSVTFSKPLKKCVLLVSSLFNKDIQLWIMTFFWGFRCTVDGILHKAGKVKLLLTTVLMWAFYMSAYYFLGKAVSGQSLALSFNWFFSLNNHSSMFSLLMNRTFPDYDTSCYIVFNLITSVVLILFSLIMWLVNRKKTDDSDAELILPYSSESISMNLLTIYFSNIKDRSYIQSFLDINHGISIIRNCSSGSNATTLLCMKDGRMIFRKYALGGESEKLNEQIEWIMDNKDRLSLTEILDKDYDGQVCWYDMPYLAESIGLFDYIHSSPVDNSWEIICAILEDLEKSYKNEAEVAADNDTIREYVSAKVFENIKRINEFGKLKSLMTYDTVIINGKEYKNLPCFMDRFMSCDFWIDAFKDDHYSNIHGDLTIENIICNRSCPRGYYLIDPNGGNIHNSPNLDYAKLFQSLHGGYEFLMRTNAVKVNGNEITFNMTRSSSYDVLYNKLTEHIKEMFTPERVRSIYLHEIIHWFRLIPYKINNDSERSILFYAGLIITINDILGDQDNE